VFEKRSRISSTSLREVPTVRTASARSGVNPSLDGSGARIPPIFLALLLLAATAAVLAAEAPVRDPMQPFAAVAGDAAVARGEAGYALTAVLISSARRVAVLNGRLYREGDRIDGAEIARIEPSAVHLKQGDRETVVKLAGRVAPAGTRDTADSSEAVAADSAESNQAAADNQAAAVESQGDSGS
jgi:hypothetical protein